MYSSHKIRKLLLALKMSVPDVMEVLPSSHILIPPKVIKRREGGWSETTLLCRKQTTSTWTSPERVIGITGVQPCRGRAPEQGVPRAGAAGAQLQGLPLRQQVGSKLLQQGVGWRPPRCPPGLVLAPGGGRLEGGGVGGSAPGVELGLPLLQGDQLVVGLEEQQLQGLNLGGVPLLFLGQDVLGGVLHSLRKDVKPEPKF